MTTQVRRPTRRSEQRKSAIVASAVDVLNRKGVRGMTLSEVAASLNLVPTGVIYYFKNKEELAAACFLNSIARFSTFIRAAESVDDTRGRLKAFIAAWLENKRQICRGEAEDTAFFNDVRALNSPPVNEAYTAMFRATRNLFGGLGTEDLSRQHRNARTHLLLSEVFWTIAWFDHGDVESCERSAGRMLSILNDGMAAPGVGWPVQALPPLVADTAEGEGSAELFLRAATELINEEGYLGASVEKISARLNVTKGAFYHHNETKDELVVACFERTFDVMRRAIRAAEAVSASGLEALASASVALVEYQLAGNAPLLRTSALTSAPEAIQPELLAKFDRISGRFASLISDGIADGSLRPIDVNVGAQMITAMINAAAELHYWTPGMDPKASADLYVRPLFQGLLARGAA